MMDSSTIMIVGGGTSAIILLFALFWDDSVGGSVSKRLSRVSGNSHELPQIKTKEEMSLRKTNSDSGIKLLNFLIKSCLPNPDKLRKRLARTGRPTTLGEYLIVNALMVMICYLCFSVFAGFGLTSSILAGIAVGLYLPHMVTGRRGNKRISKFLAAFPESIDTMCRGLRSGLPITEAIHSVGKEMPDPIGIEFRHISDDVRIGRPLDDAMWSVSNRLDTPEYRFFIIALAIQRETGGNLAETLGNLADLLRRRRQLKLKIKAMSSEARASAMIIGSLPFVMFALLMVVNSGYISLLLYDPRGQVLMGIGLTWLSIGILVMKGMVNFEI